MKKSYVSVLVKSSKLLWRRKGSSVKSSKLLWCIKASAYVLKNSSKPHQCLGEVFKATLMYKSLAHVLKNSSKPRQCLGEVFKATLMYKSLAHVLKNSSKPRQCLGEVLKATLMYKSLAHVLKKFKTSSKSWWSHWRYFAKQVCSTLRTGFTTQVLHCFHQTSWLGLGSGSAIVV